jgi:hypothetical protein
VKAAAKHYPVREADRLCSTCSTFAGLNLHFLRTRPALLRRSLSARVTPTVSRWFLRSTAEKRSQAMRLEALVPSYVAATRRTHSRTRKNRINEAEEQVGAPGIEPGTSRV